MGLQLIFVVETNKKCKSDWIYIKDTIDQFYQYDQAQIKLSPVYMGGKGKYIAKEKEISSLISQYATASKANQSKVIYCFDSDDYDKKPADSNFLQEVRQYCSRRGCELVWFCKDIESVYLGRKVEDSKKQKEAATFKTKKLIAGVDADRLLMEHYQANTSNLMRILDKYLTRK